MMGVRKRRGRKRVETWVISGENRGGGEEMSSLVDRAVGEKVSEATEERRYL